MLHAVSHALLLSQVMEKDIVELLLICSAPKGIVLSDFAKIFAKSKSPFCISVHLSCSSLYNPDKCSCIQRWAQERCVPTWMGVLYWTGATVHVQRLKRVCEVWWQRWLCPGLKYFTNQSSMDETLLTINLSSTHQKKQPTVHQQLLKLFYFIRFLFSR